MKIKLSKEEVSEILQKHFNTTGEVNFLMTKKTVGAGSLDGVRMTRDVETLDCIEIDVNHSAVQKLLEK